MLNRGLKTEARVASQEFHTRRKVRQKKTHLKFYVGRELSVYEKEWTGD